MISPTFLRPLFVSTVLFLAYVAHGRTPPVDLNQNTLEKYLLPYAKVNKLSAQFKQKKRIKDLDIELLSEGKMIFEKPQKIQWIITKPSPIEVQIDAEKISISSSKAGQRQTQILQLSQISENQNTMGFSLFVPWIQRDAAKILSVYKVAQINDHHLVFTSKKPSLFRSIDMRTGKNGLIEKMTFLENTEDSLEISFQAIKIEAAR